MKCLNTIKRKISEGDFAWYSEVEVHLTEILIEEAVYTSRTLIGIKNLTSWPLYLNNLFLYK